VGRESRCPSVKGESIRARPSQQMRDLGIVQYGAPILAEPARPFVLPDEREAASSVVMEHPRGWALNRQRTALTSKA
jgi:hypothetical protein